MLASVGSVGDAYDNALAESFVDSFKTELITDRVWQSRPQLELAIVEYVGWFNGSRLHESLGDIPPVEYEQPWPALTAATSTNPDDQSVAAVTARAAEALTTRRLLAVDVETVADDSDHAPPASIVLDVDAVSRPHNRHDIAGSAALSLRSPSGLAPRDGGGEQHPEGATTLTIKRTRPN